MDHNIEHVIEELKLKKNFNLIEWSEVERISNMNEIKKKLIKYRKLNKDDYKAKKGQQLDMVEVQSDEGKKSDLSLPKLKIAHTVQPRSPRLAEDEEKQSN